MQAACQTCTATYNGRMEHCPVCRETFTAAAAGDKHRRGEPGVKTGPNRRRCLTETEMLDKGMIRDERGRWKSTAETYTGPARNTDG